MTCWKKVWHWKKLETPMATLLLVTIGTNLLTTPTCACLEVGLVSGAAEPFFALLPFQLSKYKHKKIFCLKKHQVSLVNKTLKHGTNLDTRSAVTEMKNISLKLTLKAQYHLWTQESITLTEGYTFWDTRNSLLPEKHKLAPSNIHQGSSLLRHTPVTQWDSRQGRPCPSTFSIDTQL